MLKYTALISLLFLFVIAGGCSSKVPSIQDELREIDGDLQWVMVDIELALEQCEKLERELHLVNTWYGEHIEYDAIIGDSIFYSEGMADQLVKQLKELQEDIGDAQYRLTNIARGG